MAGTYKEILARFKKDLGNTYQAQKNIVDVSQKYIGLLENAEGGGSGGGGIDYSTDEQDTGLKWIDGKKIYQKTYSFTTPASGQSLTLDTIATLDKIIEINGLFNILGTDWYVFPDTQSSENQAIVYYESSSHKILCYVAGSARAERAAIATIKYTKA